jgi:hypothetical protein
MTVAYAAGLLFTVGGAAQSRLIEDLMSREVIT